MSIQYHIDQKVVCISEFPQVIEGVVVIKPLRLDAVYTVLLPLTNNVNSDKGLVIKGHEKLHNTTELAIYSEVGFMPLDLWVKNSKYVDELMKKIL